VLAGGVALLVAALADTQGIISWRQNAAIAQLASVEGVVPELDGSVPGLLLTADTALHAWDADTGAPRWSSTGLFDLVEGANRPSILVIRSRVYVLTSTGVLALDGRSGKPLWRVKPDKGQVATTLLTDAHHLFIGYERADKAGTAQLVAYPFDEGAPTRHTAYPDGIEHVVVRDGTLVGYDPDYTRFTLLS
jgi:hypothetical protein